MTAAALWTITVFGVGLGLGVWAAWAFFEARAERRLWRPPELNEPWGSEFLVGDPGTPVRVRQLPAEEWWPVFSRAAIPGKPNFNERALWHAIRYGTWL